MNNTLEGINSRITEWEHMSDLEDRMVEITATGQDIEKRMKRNEDNLRYLWSNIKCSNICRIGVPEWEERVKGPKKIFKEIAENFPNMVKEIVNQVQEAVSGRIDLRRNTPRHIVIKLTKIKGKDSKRNKWETTNNIQIISHQVIIWFLNRNSASQKGMAQYI